MCLPNWTPIEQSLLLKLYLINMTRHLGLLLLCHSYIISNIIWTGKIIFRSVLKWHATVNAIILIQWLITTKLLNFINTQTFQGNRFKNTSDNCEELRITMIFNDFQWFCPMCHATMKGEMLQWTKKYESLNHNLNTEKNTEGNRLKNTF